MDILEVLTNMVCRDHMLSFLEVNDLLRLRRVSKTFKDDAEDFIRTKKMATKSTIIFDLSDDDPFEDFNEFRDHLNDLPIRTKAYISFADKKGKVRMLGNLRQDLMNTYGTSITHLELSGVTLPLYSESKFKFFDFFTNVTHLVIANVFPPSEDEFPSLAFSVNARELKIPASLKKLKSLIVRDVADSGSTFEQQRIFYFIAKLVETCLPTLEVLGLPYDLLSFAEVDMQQVMRLLCKCLFTCPKLKLHFVNGLFIEDLLNPNQRTPEMGTLVAAKNSLNDKIVSILFPTDDTLDLELPNLEHIIFALMDECMMPETEDFVRPCWPKLKNVEVDLKDYEEGSMSPKPQEVWDFLFGNGIRRGNVESLKIEFEGFQDENTAAGEETLPRTMDVITSCPNLNVLQFKKEIKQLVNLRQLWEGLPLLEDVRFEDCKDLADSDFIGDDAQNPVFWNLKKLKILKLEKIDGPQLTNALLSKVLCHMPIQHLTLSSDSSSASGQHSGLEICSKDNLQVRLKALISGISISAMSRLTEKIILNDASDRGEWLKMTRNTGYVSVGNLFEGTENLIELFKVN